MIEALPDDQQSILHGKELNSSESPGEVEGPIHGAVGANGEDSAWAEVPVIGSKVVDRRGDGIPAKCHVAAAGMGGQVSQRITLVDVVAPPFAAITDTESCERGAIPRQANHHITQRDSRCAMPAFRQTIPPVADRPRSVELVVVMMVGTSPGAVGVESPRISHLIRPSSSMHTMHLSPAMSASPPGRTSALR